MAESTATNPTLLQEQVASLLVQPLEAASVVLAAGPKIFDTANVLRVPKLTAGHTPSFVGEGGHLADNADVTFGELKLMPTERKSIKSILRYSNELVRQSVVGIDAVLKQRLVKDVSDALDTALLTGSGAADSITGLLNQANTQTAALDTGEPDSLLDAIALAHAAEVTPNRWLINSQDFVALRKIKDNEGRYILEADLTADATYRLFGIPVTPTNKLPQGTAVLADVGQIAVARDTSPSVTVLSERYAEYDQIGLRVTCRYDLGLLHPEGVIILSAGPLTYEVDLGGADGGTFTLTYKGRQTAPIAYNAAASAIKSALVALDDGHTADDFTVTGSAGVFTVEVPSSGTLGGDGASLTNGSLTVERA